MLPMSWQASASHLSAKRALFVDFHQVFESIYTKLQLLFEKSFFTLHSQ
jgi:ABC-type nitrate/sulfonate/bicarbonate transport system permease component